MTAGGKGLPEEVRAVSRDTVLTRPLNFFFLNQFYALRHQNQEETQSGHGQAVPGEYF